MKLPRKLYQEHRVDRPRFEALIRPHFLPSEQKQIMRAYRLAKYGHRTQMREGGVRYFDHVRAVAVLLIMIGVRDADVICAAFLHDVIEDQFILLFEDIDAWFGPRVCHFVQMVTKVDELTTEQYFERLATDRLHLPGSWLVKCADRLHNLSTLVDGDADRREKFRQKKIKQVAETREFVLPLARSLSGCPGYEAVGRWFVHQLSTWCDLREKEAAAA